MVQAPLDQAAPPFQFSQELKVGSAISWAENPKSWSWNQKPSLCLSLPLSTWCWAESRANAFSKCCFNHKGFAKLTPQRRT